MFAKVKLIFLQETAKRPASRKMGELVEAEDRMKIGEQLSFLGCLGTKKAPFPCGYGALARLSSDLLLWPGYCSIAGIRVYWIHGKHEPKS